MNAFLLRMTSILTFAVLLLVLAGCDSNEDEEQQLLPNGFMTARVDGQEFTANGSVFALSSGGVFGLSGGDASGRVIGLGGILETGVQTIGTGDPANATYSVAGAAWAANAVGGSGTITITELDTDHIAGTFSFVASASPGSSATGTRTVTEGEFDIEFNSTEQ